MSAWELVILRDWFAERVLSTRVRKDNIQQRLGQRCQFGFLQQLGETTLSHLRPALDLVDHARQTEGRQLLARCRGYVREDAARIGFNVILFALQQWELVNLRPRRPIPIKVQVCERKR